MRPLPVLDEPVIVAALDGWVDAGSAATTALAVLAERSTVIATFDADALFDYRSRRPALEIRDGRLSSIAWPELVLRHARLGTRDLLLLSGSEPDDRWHSLADAVVELLGRLEVRAWISLGAIPAAVPAHPSRTDPRHVVAAGAPARRCRPGPDGPAEGPGGRPVDAGDGGDDGRHRGGRVLRPDPPLRHRPVRARRGGAAPGAGAPPRRRAAPRRPGRGGARAADPAGQRRPRRTRRRAPTSSASSRWSTSRDCPRATTSSPRSSGSCATGAAARLRRPG